MSGEVLNGKKNVECMLYRGVSFLDLEPARRISTGFEISGENLRALKKARKLESFRGLEIYSMLSSRVF